jgi:hypothetical protein
MANDGQIVFEVTADGRRAISDIHDITNTIQKETKQWDDAAQKSTDNINNSFSGMLKKVVAGFSAAKIGQALLSIGKDAISAASDLEEVQNVVDVTFGANNSKIESWAKSAGAQFGLTETQAKKFTSTIGAMMKSAGMSGDKIADMSTDLAGLAADMASFYNLDFDTAFQKIRSGISGETEPLKQLGINMSVANLNAFALQQGLSKTFEQMDQGEQTMLRYQYLMQATADAQGDFSRTSDGYANSVRKLETNLEQLKTTLGKSFIDVVTQATGFLNSFIESLTPDESKKTVLDDFANIDLQTETKLEQIRSTAEEARLLTAELDKINGEKSENAAKKVNGLVEGLNSIDLTQGKAGIVKDFIATLSADMETLTALTGKDANGAKDWLEEIGHAADSLDPNDAAGWKTLVDTIKEGLPGLENTDFGTKFFNALNEIEIGEKAKTIKEFIGTLSSNIQSVAELRGDSAQGAKEWLDGIAESANKLDPEDAEGWATLLKTITEGLPGLENTDFGKAFFEALGEGLGDVEQKSSVLEWAIDTLGNKTSRTAEEQALWLETCKRLVKTIPGLSSIINTETGEIKGGTQAVKDYIKAWEEGQTKLVLLGALEQKEQALSTRFADLPELQLNMALAQKKARDARKKLAELYGTVFDEQGRIIDRFNAENKNKYEQGLFNVGEVDDAFESYNKLIKEEDDATTAYENQKTALDEAKQALEEYRETIDEMPGTVEQAAEASEQFWTDNADNIKTVVSAAHDAVTAMADYAKGVHDAMAQSVNSVAKGLGRVDYQAYGKTIDKIHELATAQIGLDMNSDEYKKLQAEIDKLNEELTTTTTIQNNLKSQSDFLDEYLKNLQEAREMGLSNELLAELSDGSVESAEYLSALVSDKEAAKEIDKQYQEIQKKKAALTEELANQQLTVDETYQNLASKAAEAVAALDLQGEAAKNAGATVEGIAQGIADHVDSVAEQVDAILAQLNRLNGYGINIDFGGFGSINFTTSTGKKAEGSGRMGIDFVPHDDYLARLHEGERVLTAQENQIWNTLRGGGIAGFDLDQLGGVMRDNVKPGGNVYLDGRVVGEVISARQGQSYRQLQRSGWQGS